MTREVGTAVRLHGNAKCATHLDNEARSRKGARLKTANPAEHQLFAVF